MSDLSLRLQQAHSQLPVTSYFDEALFQREMTELFGRGPRYVGHAASVPEVGDYHVLTHEGNGRVLVRQRDGSITLQSNVCRHRQAVMLQGRGNLQHEGKGHAGGNIVCPLHRWTYSGSGQLIGAPHFAQDPCLHLSQYRLQEWNGLLFEDGLLNSPTGGGRDIAADLAGMGPRAELDFSGYTLDRVELHECNYNWKTFIEVYLEDYHVGPFHPGLGRFVTCDDLQWEFKEHYSVQTVGVSEAFERPGSPTYRRWHDALLKYRNGQKPERGAIWLTYYPHIMVEWYPHVLTVSTLHPISVDKTLNKVEFYYPEEITAFEREFVEAQQAAYMETCIEDDEIAERMDAGRKALMLRGQNEVGPYQSPMEDGMQHFHEWYRRQLGL
ncbi:aromatic ring-hydroxylating oxygenase subunit alpha [Hylemonella gracilis]|uniref:Rieske (2fe-2S) domain-containing protein n=1 Tax=Hylemonella gracilis ATCC 19624 TaxID=887062 RepID=F3KXM5_9BURK|nr:aromatic ring-hydroxylating dioxygenase subunit alpha [Hylemonella gracilis]EGI75479.1 rieske (2fe-2S) domain-containing protein [Hylemonella gracilis ATCC 19624]